MAGAKSGRFFVQLLVLTLIMLLFDNLTGGHAASGQLYDDDANASIPSSRHKPHDLVRSRHTQLASNSRFRNLPATRPSTPADLVLAETAILTTVEGGLYAIDRRTGAQLWSLPPHSSHESDSLLRPLVTALYGKDQRSFADIVQGSRSFASPFGTASVPELEAGGIYIVEPSSAGDIYVLSSKAKGNTAGGSGAVGSQTQTDASPGQVQLDKLPLTLPQLVELSPFSFAGDDTRVFVGQKQTTLVELNIHTGELGAVFGGRQGGVWCGAQAHGIAAGSASTQSEAADSGSCIDDEPSLSGSSSRSTSQLAYIGRTDYTLNIHSRNSPQALQTLHFSTFAPNAGDRDVQTLWLQADHPDQRAIMGMPEDGSVVCFNLTHSAAAGETDYDAASPESQTQTLWTSDLRASVAGIFDVVYPAPHLQNTKSLSRPILVSHPPIPLHRIFPQIGDDESDPIFDPATSSEHRSAYLGIAGDSLFAMSTPRFPLVAFTSRAVAGLPAGSVDEPIPSSQWSQGLPSSGPGSQWAEERKCSSFGCWLGSYSIHVDVSAEGRLQDSLLGASPLLEIDGGRPRLAIGDRPAFPWEEDFADNATADGSRSASSSPRASTGQPSTGENKGYHSRRPGSRHPSESSSSSSSTSDDDDDDDDDGSEANDAEISSRSWKANLAIMLLQVIGVLVIAILAGATYLGLQEQKARAEKQAAEIAKGVVWIPVLKEDEAGFGDGAMAEKIRAEEKRQLERAIQLSKNQMPSGSQADETVGQSSTAAQNGRVADEDGDKDVAEGQETPGATSAGGKKKPNKRRRRGKRAGAAVAAKAAKTNGSPDGGEGGDDDNDEDEEEDPNGSKEAAPPMEVTQATPKKSIRESRQDSGSSGAMVSDSASSNGNEPETPKTRLKTLETKSKARTSASVGNVHKASESLQRAQDLMSPQLKSPLLGSGWTDLGGGEDNDSAASVGRAAAQIAAGAGRHSGMSQQNTVSASSLTISDEVLGYGSSGTVVFKGTFQGRAVAVKRLLRDFVHVASKEVSLLESADNHPNVIRYFYKELTPSFLFIALELCPASLAEVVERPADHRELSNLLDPKRALSQITSGLRHLHSLSIVHRDIKPQNILVATSSSGRSLKMLLSDFGLSKRLDGMAQTSFSQTVNNPGGTVGWRAPEILRGDINLDAGSESESSMGNNSGSGSREGMREEKQRLTRAVDVFALGCLAYYVLSNGDHPFGSRFEREMNIIRKRVDLSRLDGLGEEGHEAQDLVLKMVSHDPRHRPSAAEVLTHPYFWDPNKRLNFLQDASDRFEIMDKEAPTPALVLLESRARNVLGTDWHRRCDKMFLDNLGKFRKYDPSSVQDLLRAMRNKKHHYQDLPPSLKKVLGPLPDGYLGYFTRRFPELFLHVYNTIVQQPLIRTEPVFREYFNCAEPDH